MELVSIIKPLWFILCKNSDLKLLNDPKIAEYSWPTFSDQSEVSVEMSESALLIAERNFEQKTMLI